MINNFERKKFTDYSLYWLNIKALFGSRILENKFSWPRLPKNKRRKSGQLLDQNHGLTPSEKYPLFAFLFTSCFYSLERRFFDLEYRKTHSFNPHYLKKKIGKMAIFRPKPWVNPFGKMSIFRLFQLLVVIA